MDLAETTSNVTGLDATGELPADGCPTSTYTVFVEIVESEIVKVPDVAPLTVSPLERGLPFKYH